MLRAMKFVVCKIYSLDEIERISGRLATVNQLSYATIAAVIIGNDQYDFVFYPFSEGEGWTLIAVNGDPPPKSSH